MNQYLREARENAGLTQWQVADKSGVSEVSYQRYEYNMRIPNVRTAIRIATALNSTVEDLFKEQQNKPDGNQARHG